MSLVSIIIVNYNGKHFLKDCLLSIKASASSDEEVILVDNASSDGSCDYVNVEFPWVKVIALDKNYGFAEANNRGAQAASGRYLAFLNNDTVVTRGWLKHLLGVVSADPSVAAAGSKLLLYDAPEKLNSAGANIVFNGGGYDIGLLDDDAERYNILGPRGAVCAASMMVRKGVFQSLGGFDSRYFMYFEDVDLCWRFWLFGYKVVYAPKSVVYHKFGGTAGGSRHSPLRLFYGTRNVLLNIVKNYEACNVPLPLCFNALYHFAKLLFFLATLRFRGALTIVKAYCSFFTQVPAVLRERARIQAGRTVRDSFLFQNRLIVSLFTAAKEALRLHKK